MPRLAEHIWKEVETVGRTIAAQVLLQQEAPLPYPPLRPGTARHRVAHGEL